MHVSDFGFCFNIKKKTVKIMMTQDGFKLHLSGISDVKDQKQSEKIN